MEGAVQEIINNKNFGDVTEAYTDSHLAAYHLGLIDTEQLLGHIFAYSLSYIDPANSWPSYKVNPRQEYFHFLSWSPGEIKIEHDHAIVNLTEAAKTQLGFYDSRIPLILSDIKSLSFVKVGTYTGLWAQSKLYQVYGEALNAQMVRANGELYFVHCVEVKNKAQDALCTNYRLQNDDKIHLVTR